MRDRVMPLTDHLEELRRRIFIILGAVGAGFFVGYFVAHPILIWMLQVVRFPHVIVIGVTEAFFAMLKVAFIVGLVIASPIILYQIAAFVMPGLTPAERKMVGWVLVPGVVLFVGGMAAGFFLIVPTVLHIMLGFTGPDIKATFTLSSVLSFVINLTLPFGVIAELPLVAGSLARLGFLSPAWFERQRRYAIVLAFFIAAIFAPPDAVSMLLMAIPIYLIYELSALVVRLMWRESSTALTWGQDDDLPPDGPDGPDGPDEDL